MTRNQRIQLVVLTAISLVITSSAAIAQGKKNGGGGGGGGSGSDYRIVQLETTDGVGTHDDAYDVNDFRDIAGRATLPTGELTAAYWTVTETNGVVQSSLQLLDDGNVATAINNHREIVGQTYGGYGNPIGVYWASPTSPAVVLPRPEGYDVSLPDRINDDGVICGMVAVDGQSQSSIPVLWQVTYSGGSSVVNPPILLPSFGPGSSAQDINNSDASGVFQVVGMQRTTWTPLLWEVHTLPNGTLSIPAAPQVLVPVGGAFATGVNQDGQVCGRTEYDAVVWSNGMGSLLNRPGKGKNKVPRAWAWDIGDSGIIVGQAGTLIDSRACFWNGTGGSLIFLDSFLDANSPLVGLSRARAVNGSGDIVGGGWYGAFIALPQ